MSPVFRALRDKISPQSDLKAGVRKRRRLMTALGSLIAVVMLPSALFQLVLYRQNLAVARETFPLTKPIHKRDRLLIISPHCDDETLGAGGTMASARGAGASVRVVFITNGDGSRSTQVVARAQEFESEVKALARPATWNALLASHGDLVSKNPLQKNLFERIAAMRQDEAMRACAVLGVAKKNVTFLGYPDGGTRAMWETNWSKSQPYFSGYTKTSSSPYVNSFTRHAKYCGAQVVSDLEKIIREFRPTVILTTHPEDTHPDHWAAYAYTSAALETLRLSGNASTRVMASGVELRTFLVHHGVWPAPHGYRPHAELAPPASLENSGTRWEQEPLAIKNRDAKKSALDCYASQLVFTPHYLRSFIRKNELFGEVPATSFNSKFKIQNSKLLLKDAPADSSWRERWPAADVRALEAAPVKEGVLALRIDLGRAPSSSVRYALALHILDGQSTRAWKIEARPVNGALQATLIGLDEKALTDNNRGNSPMTLKGEITARGFEIQLPLQAMRVLRSRSATVLVSASTHAGRARLDQTATAILRLQTASK